MKYLRIVFTILSAVCVAGAVPFGFLFGWWAAGACALGAMIFFGLMLLCKNSQEKAEENTVLPMDEDEPKKEE